MEKACLNLGNHPDDIFRLKVVQIEELLQIRHCVFVMGPPGAGKSQCWRTLAEARALKGPEGKTKVRLWPAWKPPAPTPCLTHALAPPNPNPNPNLNPGGGYQPQVRQDRGAVRLHLHGHPRVEGRPTLQGAPACLPACLPASLPRCLPASLPRCLPASRAILNLGG